MPAVIVDPDADPLTLIALPFWSSKLRPAPVTLAEKAMFELELDISTLTVNGYHVEELKAEAGRFENCATPFWTGTEAISVEP